MKTTKEICVTSSRYRHAWIGIEITVNLGFTALNTFLYLDSAFLHLSLRDFAHQKKSIILFEILVPELFTTKTYMEVHFPSPVLERKSFIPDSCFKMIWNRQQKNLNGDSPLSYTIRLTEKPRIPDSWVCEEGKQGYLEYQTLL